MPATPANAGALGGDAGAGANAGGAGAGNVGALGDAADAAAATAGGSHSKAPCKPPGTARWASTPMPGATSGCDGGHPVTGPRLCPSGIKSSSNGMGVSCIHGTQETMASVEVLGNRDLVARVLRYAELDPVSFVYMGLVNRAWRDACQGDQDLLLRAAAGRYYMTKRALMGLTGLTSDEANTLPRTLKQRPRSREGGVMWAYSPIVAPAALAMVGGMEGRRIRLAYRAIASTSKELSFVGGRGYDCHPRTVYSTHEVAKK